MRHTRRQTTAAFAFAILMTPGCGMTSQEREPDFVLSSLDMPDYAGKKYYFGWGEHLDGFMGNETKFDVKHTHDIFTSGVGGSYAATTLTGRPFGGREVKAAMQEINTKIGASDMYVQYSSGHGYPQGLGIGVQYADIVNNALSMQAKEVVVFLMACHSGGLVDQFNARKSTWSDWNAKGRTLFVMSSSTVQQTSSTGPGTDAQESGGPAGSAGSAYGHALWKTLIGEADGYVDGVKDGFVSLGEIAAYATYKTQRVGRHTPQVTGSYNPNLIMNKVPARSVVEGQAYAGGTGRMSETEVRALSDRADAAVEAEVARAVAAQKAAAGAGR